MALTMRPTALGSGHYADTTDFSIFCGAWNIGRIFETRTSPDGLPFFWSMYAPSKPGEIRTSNQVATLEIEIGLVLQRYLWEPCG
jgi:hypothetical protein